MVSAPHSTLLNRAQKVYQKCLETNPEAHKLLRAVGLDSGAYALALGTGYADGTSFKKTMTLEERRECQALGLFGKKHMDLLYGYLTFPLMKDGVLKAFLGWGQEKIQKKVVGDSEGAFLNPEALDRHKDFILTDSPTLYVQFRQLGFNETLCLPSPEGAYLSERLKVVGARSVALITRKSMERLSSTLRDAPVKLLHLSIDKNLTLTEELIREALKKARVMREVFPNPATLSEATSSPQRSSSPVSSKGARTISLEEVTYMLQPIDLNSASLKVILTAEVGGSRYTDKIDLYLAVSRRAFAKACAEKFLMEESRFEGDLHKVIQELERIRDSGREGQIEVREISEQDAASIEATLKNPSILDEFVSDMRQTGFVGEDLNLKVSFLMAISRLLDKPLSIILQSSAGSGKSHLLNLLCAITPPESLIFVSKLTPSSLFYMPDLRHKMLVVDEAHGSSEALYPLRTLISNKKLVLAVPMRDAGSGVTVTKQIMVRGPVSYVESTTADKLHPENASRAILLSMDESPEQTQRILESQLQEVQQGFEDRADGLQHKWQNIQRALSQTPLRVFIPFAHRLKFPLGPNARRDHQKMLSLIQAVALLKSRQKKIQQDAIGSYIEATPEDYKITFDLLVPLIRHPQDELSERAKEFLDLLKGRPRSPFTRRQIMEEFKMPYSRVQRSMSELESHEIVAAEASVRGQAGYYTLLDTFLPGSIQSGLTLPNEIQRDSVSVNLKTMESS